MILNLDLIRNGYPSINVTFTDSKRYYDTFDAYYRDDKVEAMVELIGEYVDKRLDEYFRILDSGM